MSIYIVNNLHLNEIGFSGEFRSMIAQRPDLECMRPTKEKRDSVLSCPVCEQKRLLAYV